MRSQLFNDFPLLRSLLIVHDLAPLLGWAILLNELALEIYHILFLFSGPVRRKISCVIIVEPVILTRLKNLVRHAYPVGFNSRGLPRRAKCALPTLDGILTGLWSRHNALDLVF